MRALTLTQPWAGLVAAGIKTIENRPRPMIKSADFGTPFAIHASREHRDGIYQAIISARADLRSADHPWHRLSKVTSAIVGVATIIQSLAVGGCSDAAISRAFIREKIDLGQIPFATGPMIYVLDPASIRALPEPVPARGYQGFWTLSPGITELVEAQLARTP